MLLAIDVGNTNTLFAIHDGENFVGEWRCATDHQRTADEYYVWLNTLMKLEGHTYPIDAVIVSAVVPQVVFNLRLLCNRYYDCRPIVVGKPDCELPVGVRVDAGTKVGADRLVNTVGAYDRHGGGLIVVDFGTATTFDVVDLDGAYIGGTIAPGVNLSLRALSDATAALPFVDVTRPPKAIGTNTEICMQSGVFWGYVGLVEANCRAIKEEFGKPMKVIGTGGLSTLFDQGTDVFDALEGDITLHGLVLIYRYNMKDLL